MLRSDILIFFNEVLTSEEVIILVNSYDLPYIHSKLPFWLKSLRWCKAEISVKNGQVSDENEVLYLRFANANLFDTQSVELHLGWWFISYLTP